MRMGNRISATYYANGFKNTATDGRGTVTATTYDAYGQPLTSRTGTHPAINFTYDSIGRMTDLTDQVGSSTRFVYDKRSLLQSKTDPLNRTSAFTYDETGRLSTKTDRNNHTITYTYTPSDKLERVTYPNASSVNFTYNQLDNLGSMQDSLGTTSHTYDAANRLTSVTDPHGFSVSYTYEAGNLKEITYPGNKKVIYTYDELNRLQTVKINWLNQTATYAYDAAGRLTGLTNFNGTVTTYGYDNANRLTSFENKKSDASVISSYQFTLDPNGNRIQETQNEPLVPRLEAGDTSYAYNPQKNRLLSAGAVSFGYDNEGQLSTGYASSYTFDYEHRLVGIDSSYRFYYDGAGNRLQAVREGTTTRYIYDASGTFWPRPMGQTILLDFTFMDSGSLRWLHPQTRFIPTTSTQLAVRLP